MAIQNIESEAGPNMICPPVEREKWTTERVLSVHHWTPTLISLRTTRPQNFRFTPGHYARLGLVTNDGSEVWRPISMVSAASDETLEFFVVLIPGGMFSAAFGLLQSGDTLRIDRLGYGFMTLEQLAAGRNLWLLASGTGLGPFVSMLRDTAVWQKFERLIVVHSVRRAAELAYGDEIRALTDHARRTPDSAQLTYLPIVTREPGATTLSTRLPQLLLAGGLEAAAGTTLEVATSRLMVCGNPAMASELRQLLAARGFATSRRNAPGQMAFENYWQADE
jgi:ferredoxin--NADP+ reductase